MARVEWRNAHWLWLTLIVIAADLLTKYWASSNLNYGQPVPVFPMFNLTLLHNTGAAFSFLADAGGWQRWFFIVLAAGVSLLLLGWLLTLKRTERWLACALALVLGGALGNLYDRATLGYVVDFLDFYWGRNHFPAFNIADTAISIGAVMMAIDIFRSDSRQASENRQEKST